MPHVRKQIRDELVSNVLNGLTTTAANVSSGRVYTLQGSDLPALLVSDENEVIDLDAGSLDAPMRELEVTVTGIVELNSGLEDTLDLIAAEVETAMRVDITQGGLAIGTDLQATTKELSGEGEKKTGKIIMLYRIQYRTPFGDPLNVA